jgi:hypothetical protein
MISTISWILINSPKDKHENAILFSFQRKCERLKIICDTLRWWLSFIIAPFDVPQSRFSRICCSISYIKIGQSLQAISQGVSELFWLFLFLKLFNTTVLCVSW